MTLTVDSLIYPNGQLLPSMFPDNDIHESVTVWLYEAVRKTTDTAAQAAWIYHRAYTSVATRIASTPSSESSFGTHSTSWSADRIEAFKKLAAEQLAEYTRLTGEEQAGSNRSAYFRVY